MHEYNNTGALIDNRTEEQKLKDFNIKEFVASVAVVDWKEKPETAWRKFPDQEQDGSGSCVAQTTKKLAGILVWLREGVWLPLSGTSIYQNRSGKPNGGMIGVEAFDIWKNKGISLEALVPSQNLSDAGMDAIVPTESALKIGEVFKISGHLGIDNGDFETVASVIQQTGKGVMVWFFFNSAEWSKLIPEVIDTSMTANNAWGRHSVAVVDFFLFNGKKYLLIEDSAHFGGLTRRLISEEFFKARNFFVRYPMNLKYADVTTPTPAPVEHFTFVEPMRFIPLDTETGSITIPVLHEAQKKYVVELQNLLKRLGLFPINIASTGYYGALTARSVLAFQKKYNVAPFYELDSLKGEYVGAKTRAKLNELY